MKVRTILLLWTVLLAGCISRGSTELLEARLRQQEDLLVQQQDDLTASKDSIAELRRENDFLNQQLAQKGNRFLAPETSQAISRVQSIRIHKLMTGMRISAENSGESVLHLVVQPVDADGEIVKVSGEFAIEFQPPQEGVKQIPDSQPVVTTFPIQESSHHWHKGVLVSGYQFEIPIEVVPSSKSGTVRVRFRTADGREFSTSYQLHDSSATIGFFIDPDANDICYTASHGSNAARCTTPASCSA